MNAQRPAGTYFLVGLLPDQDEHSFLYRIETDDPMEIIEAFQVGTHAEASYGVDALPAVLEQMAAIHARNPIVPFFADPAGFKCAFEKPVTKKLAEFLDEAITEGFEAYADDGEIGAAVIRDGYLQLWWD